MSKAAFRLRSKAFRQGLIDGFGAPVWLFVPFNYPADADQDNLQKAWDDVSRALRDSLETERRTVGETKQGRSARKDTERSAYYAQ